MTLARSTIRRSVLVLRIQCSSGRRSRIIRRASLAKSILDLGARGATPGKTSYQRAGGVTLPEARVIALKASPGKITDEELVKEKGGSGLRYSFDIKNDGVTHEVGVDAKTGKLLENSVEGPRAD
jgi:Peptidase propeptide and YPEB domain